MPVKLNSSGGGSVTLDLGSTGSTYTQTLPLINGSLVAADSGGNVSVSSNVAIGGATVGQAGYRFALQGYAASSVPLYLHSDATNAYLYSPNPVYLGSTGANTTVLVSNNTARFTVGTSGQLGIGVSPSYGSAGQVLVSGGASAAPSWASAINSATAITTTTTSFTGAATASTTLTASAVTGTIQVGQVIAGTGVTAGTTILAQTSGTTGGAGNYTISTAATISGTTTITVVGVDFLSIPSWVKRITLMLNGVSTNGTSPIQLQIGSGSIDATSYVTVSSVIGTSSAAGGSALTTAWLLVTGLSYMSASYALSGAITLVLSGSNTWIATGATSSATYPYQFFLSGTKTLSGALDRLRISTTGGTETFDAGSINILYE